MSYNERLSTALVDALNSAGVWIDGGVTVDQGLVVFTHDKAVALTWAARSLDKRRRIGPQEILAVIASARARLARDVRLYREEYKTDGQTLLTALATLERDQLSKVTGPAT